MQKYKLIEQGKDCALYRMGYDDDYHYKFLVKDKEGDILSMCVIQSRTPPQDMVELVKTYDLEKIHAERMAEHNKWVERFVEK